jgi:hypothetical protein
MVLTTGVSSIACNLTCLAGTDKILLLRMTKDISELGLTGRECCMLMHIIIGKNKEEILHTMHLSEKVYEKICSSILLKSGYKSMFRLLTGLYFNSKNLQQ